MRFYVIHFFLLCFALTSCAVNKPCSLKLDQSPELRGIRLGMTIDEVKSKYPSFGKPGVAYSKEEGFGKEIVRIDKPDPKEVESMIITFVDSKATRIKVFYNNDLNWKSADEFAKQTAKALKLDGTWEKIGQDNEAGSMRYMNCGIDFTVVAGLGKDYKNYLDASGILPYVEVANILEDFKSISRELDSKRQANQRLEEQKDTFKP